MKKSILSMLLTAAMVLCLMPTVVLAETGPEIILKERAAEDLVSAYGIADEKFFDCTRSGRPFATIMNVYWCSDTGDITGTPAEAGTLRFETLTSTVVLTPSDKARPGKYYFKITAEDGTNSNVITYTVRKNKVRITGITSANRTYDGYASMGYVGFPKMQDEEGNPYNAGASQIYFLADGKTKTTTKNSGADSDGASPVWAGDYVFIYSVESDLYEESLKIPFTIKKRNIIICAFDKAIGLNDTLPILGANDYRVTGNTVGTDTLASPIIAYNPLNPDTSKGGSVEIVVSGVTITSGRAENYNIIYKNGTLNIHDHLWTSAWITNTTHHWHECDGAGKCSIAENNEKDSYGIHTSGNWIIDTNATEEKNGSKHKECTTCGYVMETATIVATKSPQTGEGTDMLLWFVLLFISGSAITLLVTTYKSHES